MSLLKRGLPINCLVDPNTANTPRQEETGGQTRVFSERLFERI